MFEAIQKDIYDLLEDANKVIPDDDALFYGGTFITGKLETPEILFLGINPGNGDWAKRSRSFQRKPFAPSPCKFCAEFDDNERLARAVVDIVLGGDSTRLASCAESSIRSFYGTPNEPTLNRQLSHLGKGGLMVRHNDLMTRAVKLILDQCKPREIVCIGTTTFGALSKLLGLSGAAIEMKSEPSASGETDPVYYKRTEFNGIPIHGTLHLSGGHPSNTMKADLRGIFAGRVSR